MFELRHVPSSYRHHVKRAEPRGIFASASTSLKSYQIAPADQSVPEAVTVSADAFLAAAGQAIGLEEDRGFVILHRCGLDFYFLLITVWRGANEAWEAVYFRDGEMENFEIFKPAYPSLNAPLRPTFCVWELGIVTHEAKSWSRLLSSPRSATDEAIWRDDMLSAEV